MVMATPGITLPNGRRADVSSDLASVEAALRKILPMDVEERLLAQIPQWFLVTSMFKDLEVAYTALEDRSQIEPKYRAVLTAVLSLGENISAALIERPNLDLKTIGYCPTVVEANLRYLRGKYRQWFFPRDQAAMGDLLAMIHSEGE
jgi:hypothetical protein